MAAERLPALPCACANLRRAARAVTRAYDAAFSELSLKATQFTILQALERLGESSQAELGQLLGLDSTTLSRSLVPLAGADWIQLGRGSDRREQRWSLTRSGRGVLRTATKAWEAVQANLKRKLGAARWERLAEDLAEVARTEHQADDPPRRIHLRS